MGFEFGGLTENLSNKHINKVRNSPIWLLENDSKKEKSILIITPTFPNKEEIILIQKLFHKNLPQFNIIGLNATLLDLTKEELDKEQVTSFFKRNRINFEKYIPSNPYCICTIGKAIHAVTLSEDITVSSFYDFVFNSTYFYAPDIKGYVFPIDDFSVIMTKTRYGMIPLDNARRNFMELQLKNIYKLFSSLQKGNRLPIIKKNVLSTQEDVDSFFITNRDKECLCAWDIETTSLDYHTGDIICVTFSLSSYEGYYIPFNLIKKELCEEFMKTKILVGQNIKFDTQYMWKKGIHVPLPEHDTMLLSQTLYESRSNSLKSHAFYYTKFGGYENELENFKKKFSIKSYGDIPQNILQSYAIMDAIVTYNVCNYLLNQVKELDFKYPPKRGQSSIYDYYSQIKMPVYKAMIEIEYEGISVNTQRWDENSDYFENKLNILSKKIFDELESNYGEFDLSSLVQLGKVLEKKGWECLGRSKAGIYLTGDEQLLRWEQLGRKTASKIKEWRSLSTLQQTFIGKKDNTVLGWRQHIKNHKDGYRIHPKYMVMGAESGRNKCAEPNWQQLPAHGDEIKHVKNIIAPPSDDYVLATLDYKSMQIRLCAIDSNDPVLTENYTKDADPDLHSTTGFKVLASGNKYNFIILTTEDGKKYDVYEHQKIEVIRENEKIKIEAKDVRETDTFIRLL